MTSTPLEFCWRTLPEVSRTFALTIPMLPHPLDDALTVAYLLMRLADTLEDHTDAGTSGDLLDEFTEFVALPAGWPHRARGFPRRVDRVLRPRTPAGEVRLVAGLPMVLEALADQPEGVRVHVRDHVRIMTTGMADLSRRRGPQLWQPEDLTELFEYCYIVAGTVGELLTRLFAWHSAAVTAALRPLDARAVAFGRALQLTNILKDVRTDLDAGRCWLPRTVLAEHGIGSPEQLRKPAVRPRAMAVLDDLIAVAHREVTLAVEYVEALPPSERAIRRFCVETLLLAVLTLRKLRGNCDVFGPEPVKISRTAVRRSLLLSRVTAGRNALLRQLFTTLTHTLPLPSAEPPPQPATDHDDPRRTAEQAVTDALERLVAAQSPAGSWHLDYGGVLPLVPMYVVACYVSQAMPDHLACEGLSRHLWTHQNPDGGWGLDIESDSGVMASVLCYTALRLLGVPAGDERLRRARSWFLRHGGALGSAPWGKFLLAVLGLYSYEGLSPLPPELWILPRALPFHPGRWWCHTRVVYLPMSWLYGRRASAPADPLLEALRGELYGEPYDGIDWARARGRVAGPDEYRRRSLLLRVADAALLAYERRPSRGLRTRAMVRVLAHVEHADLTTNHLGLNPLGKALNMLVWQLARPGGDEVRAHAKRWSDYLWRADDGIKVQAYASSELWDTSFAVHAITATGLGPRVPDTLRGAMEFIERNQILADVPDAARHFRNARDTGGWSFGPGEQGWPVSDCTAEALMAVFALDELGFAGAVTPERRTAAVELILALQNRDGGWATYERSRGPRWLERLNPSGTFADIMIDHSYPECTSSCVQILRRYRAHHREGGDARLDRAILRGEEFLLGTQRADGSWEGGWGVCFTYGTWFGVWGLAAAGGPRARAAVDRACEFLLAHQLPDGGWGETIEGCRKRRYVHAESGQAVMTAWALLALARAGRGCSPSARRGVRFLLDRQRPDGTWPPEHLAGVFNRNTAIHYDSYLRLFPMWALAVCGREQREGGDHHVR